MDTEPRKFGVGGDRNVNSGNTGTRCDSQIKIYHHTMLSAIL